jgi:hypothetical protein
MIIEFFKNFTICALIMGSAVFAVNNAITFYEIRERNHEDKPPRQSQEIDKIIP